MKEAEGSLKKGDVISQEHWLPKDKAIVEYQGQRHELDLDDAGYKDSKRNYLHFMGRYSNGRTGWVAPLELSEDAARGGSYVLPITRSGRYAKEYNVDVTQYLGGRRTSTETLQIRESAGKSKTFFTLNVAGRTIVFTERQGDLKDIRQRYVGQLSHPDFSSVLVEVEPTSIDSLDKLLDETGFVIIGCEPWENYGGLAELGSLPPMTFSVNPQSGPSVLED